MQQQIISRCRQINIHPRRISLILAGLVILIAAGHIAVHAGSFLFDIRSTPLVGLFEFLNMGDEANLPTYVSALNLLLAGGLCILIADHESSHKKRPAWHWWGLVVGLLLMSFDEAAQIHEGIVGQFLLGYIERGEGIMHYVWYRVYIPIVFILGSLYVPFLKRLPSRYSSRFILSGLVYLGGALGFEILESYLAYHDGIIGLSILFEETLEMLGIVLLIHVLLLYLAESDYSLRLRFVTNKHNGVADRQGDTQ